MQLRKPKIEDKEKLMEYIEEHHANGEMSISASNGMPTMDYEEWLKKLKKMNLAKIMNGKFPKLIF